MYRTLSLFVIIVRAAASETISDADRAYLVSHLQMTREFVRDTTRGLTNEQWVYQPRPGSWSIAQCIDHLARTEEYVLRLVRERLLTSTAPLLGAFPSTAKDRKAVIEQPRRMSMVEDAFILRWMTDRTPAVAVPVDRRPPIQEISPRASIVEPRSALDHFLNVRATTLEYIKVTKDDLRGHFAQAPMPELPDMKFSDAYQWLLRMSAHTERHLMQIHEVRRSDRYPVGR